MRRENPNGEEILEQWRSGEGPAGRSALSLSSDIGLIGEGSGRDPHLEDVWQGPRRGTDKEELPCPSAFGLDRW